MIVYLACVSWDAVAGTDRHLVESLGRRLPVLWVDPPMSWVGRRRHGVTVTRLTSAAPGVTRLHTVAPPGVSRPGVRAVSRSLVRRQVRRVLAMYPEPVLAVVATSPEPLLTGWPDAARIYYATDDFVAGASLLGCTPRYAKLALAANLRAADHVLAVSDTLAQTLNRSTRPAVVLPNGCSPEHYHQVDELPAAADVTLSRPIAGLVGQLNERIDLTMLEAVACNGDSLLLVGPRYEQQPATRRRLDALLERDNVQWVGRQPFHRLPAYLAAIDVGLTPYTDTAFNRASFPLKTLEYLAAGRAVVSTDLPSARWLGTDLIDLAVDQHTFALMVQARLREQRTPELAAMRRRFAGQHSWDARADQLLGLIG